MPRCLLACLWFLSSFCSGESLGAPEFVGERVLVLSLKRQIDRSTVFVLKRGLRQAKDLGAHLLIDMDTPGGQLKATLDIMEALGKFREDGARVLIYVNKNAISAGSYLALAGDDIYFHPKGLMGAAEVVSGDGSDVGESMKRKIDSYLRALIRTYGSEYPMRALVQRAMMDPDYELVVDGQVLKEKGELLSLTAKEAAQLYGEPPQRLLSAGTAKDLKTLIEKAFGANSEQLTFKLSVSERLSFFLSKHAGVLQSLGMLFLFLEFSAPGFGIFGILGVGLLCLVYLSGHIASLAGHETWIFTAFALIFGLGLLSLLVEIFVVPGTLLFGIVGLILALIALTWMGVKQLPDMSRTDAWVNVLGETLLGLLLALLLAFLAFRFFIKTRFRNHLVLDYAIRGTGKKKEKSIQVLVGKEGCVVQKLHPQGLVEIEDENYRAHSKEGQIEAGETVRVVGKNDLGLEVKKINRGA